MAQNSSTPECGTITTIESLNYIKNIIPKLEKYEQEFYALSNTQGRGVSLVNSIPIKVHIIRASNGSGGLSETDLNDAIDNMNAFYANAFMEFFICDGINYINNDNYYDFDTSEENALTSAHNVSGLINIYFTDYVESSSSGSSLCGYAYGPGGPDVILMANSCAINGSTLPHEVGHFFSLIHTHGPSNSTLTTELVDTSNCSSAGDLLCDTPADPQLGSSVVDLSCIYTGTETDSNGDTFIPDPSNIMSYSRKICRTNFTTQQYARIYGTYQLIRNNFSCSSLNIDFAADVTDDCNNSLSVNFTDSSVGATSWEWDLDSDGNTDYTTQNPSHVFPSGSYDITLTISNGSTSISKTYFDYIKVGAEETLPYSENFEKFDLFEYDAWTRVDVNGNGYNWFANSGETTSVGTGPTVDHTKGTSSGVYIYAEATGANAGDEAYFISPCVEVGPSGAILEFSYHMHGPNIAQLHVDIKTDSGYDLDVTSVLDSQQQVNNFDPYLTRQINLTAYANQTINIRFRAVRGNSFNADIAIDDISLIESTLSLREKKLSDIKIYPNPVSEDVLNIQVNDLLNLDYEMLNLLGQKIQSGPLSTKQIDVSTLSSGTYFLILKEGTYKVIKKFIKQ